MNNKQFTFPTTEKQAVTETLHGIRITDNYRWLEDKTSPAVIEWTQKQHLACVDYINETVPEMTDLKADLKQLYDQEMRYSFVFRPGKLFFQQQLKGEQQARVWVKWNGTLKLLFDPEKIDPSGKTSISNYRVTKDGSKIAISVQNSGAEIVTVYFYDTESGAELYPPVEGVRGFSWTKDGKGGYILVRTREMIDRQEAGQLFYHRLGTPRTEDQFLHSPEDSMHYCATWETRDSDVHFLTTGDFYSGSVQMRQIGSKAAFEEIYHSKTFRAFPTAKGDFIYLLSNHEASNKKIFRARKEQAQFEHWETYFEEQPDAVLESFEVTEDYLVVCMNKDVISNLYLYDLDGKTLVKALTLPIVGTVMYFNYIPHKNQLLVGISSFTAYAKYYLFDLATFEWQLFHENKIALELPAMQTKQLFYESKDGTKVPMFVIHRADMELNGQNPMILTGYGGFNVNTSPIFLGSDITFIKRGGIVVKTCLRGGAEYGEQWHLDGMRYKKQNTFDDFVAAAEYLIKENYTCTEKLSIYGGSNGGLLMGAACTQRPDLFKAVVCSVPLLDMIRFHRFLIARFWIPEYGDPAIKEEFQNLLQYSPYHHIRQGIDYPTMMVIAGENDTRVDPLHAKKMVAAMQNNEGQINPIMLYMDYDSGHGSGKSNDQIIKAAMYRLRFVMGQLGMINVHQTVTINE